MKTIKLNTLVNTTKDQEYLGDIISDYITNNNHQDEELILGMLEGDQGNIPINLYDDLITSIENGSGFEIIINEVFDEISSNYYNL